MPTYVVQSGDTLSGIAQRLLGSSSRYRELQGYTGDPTKLPIGTTLSYGSDTPAAGSTGTPGADAARAGISNQDPNRPGAPVIKDGIVQPPANPADVQNREQADAFINAGQDQIITSSEEPPIRSSVQRAQEAAKAVQDTLTGGAARPAAPKYEENLRNLRTEQGIVPLEDNLNTLNAQERELRAALDTYAQEQADKPLAQRVIEGRVSEGEKNAQRELDRITREKQVVTDQLKTKYGVVETLMNAKQMDYSAAVSDYDRTFAQNVQMFNLVKGVQDEQKSDDERKRDNARANLQIISNALKDSSLSELTPDQKLNIRKLELEAGLPVGTIENFRSNDPKADIITTNEWTDASGKQYLAIVSRGEDGKINVQNQLLGQGKVTGGGSQPTEAETKLYFKQSMAGQLKVVVGADGYVSPENWRKARKAWSDNTPYAGKDFDDNFRSYVNPQHPSDYEGFEEYGAGFTKTYQ